MHTITFCIITLKYSRDFKNNLLFTKNTNFIMSCFYEFWIYEGSTDCLYEFEYMEKVHTKINTYSNEMNAYKDFHAFFGLLRFCEMSFLVPYNSKII